MTYHTFDKRVLALAITLRTICASLPDSEYVQSKAWPV